MSEPPTPPPEQVPERRQNEETQTFSSSPADSQIAPDKEHFRESQETNDSLETLPTSQSDASQENIDLETTPSKKDVHPPSSSTGSTDTNPSILQGLRFASRARAEGTGERAINDRHSDENATIANDVPNPPSAPDIKEEDNELPPVASTDNEDTEMSEFFQPQTDASTHEIEDHIKKEETTPPPGRESFDLTCDDSDDDVVMNNSSHPRVHIKNERGTPGDRCGSYSRNSSIDLTHDGDQEPPVKRQSSSPRHQGSSRVPTRPTAEGVDEDEFPPWNELPEYFAQKGAEERDVNSYHAHASREPSVQDDDAHDEFPVEDEDMVSEDVNMDDNSDAESESLFVNETLNGSPLSGHEHQTNPTPPKERRTRRKTAKTAREWHKLRNAALDPSKRRGAAYIRGQIAKIRSRFENGKSHKRSRRRAPKEGQKSHVDPRLFFSGGSGPHDAGDPAADLDESGQPQNKSRTKKGLFGYFAEQKHSFDLRKTKTDLNKLNKSSVTFGFKNMMPEGDRWRLKGMLSTLLNHQLIGVSFIVGRECDDEGPYGSICADEMGLGKTVQTIATIVANPPSPEHVFRNEKTTLIIVPSKIRGQWYKEILKHAPILSEKVSQFYSKTQDNSLAKLKFNDIVITTYPELIKSLPNPGKARVKQWVDEDLDLFEEYEKFINEHWDQRGLLHRMTWYRIVLDEGHMIKNYKSCTSRAALKLQGHHKLILSANPIMNRYSEFWPLLRFIGEPITMGLTPTQFIVQFCGHDEISFKCLSKLLSNCLIHRTMRDKLLGKSIVPLPQDYRYVRHIQSQPSELLLLQALEVRFRELRNMDLEDNDPRKPLRNHYAQLTRQRQFLANPDIIAPQLATMFTPSELEWLREKVSLMMSAGSSTMAYNLFVWLKKLIDDKKKGVYKGMVEEDATICLTCKSPAEDLFQLSRCGHIFCKSCLEAQIHREMSEEGAEVMLCPECSEPYSDTTTTPLYTQRANGRVNQHRRGKYPMARDFKAFRPSPSPKQPGFKLWLERLDEGKLVILPSAKLLALLDQVSVWLRDAPDDKIIIFTQFRHFQTMIGSMLQRSGFDFLYFSGDMTTKQREDTADMFADNPKIKILVAGLQCGGIGLNLTCANHVIVADIWWNTFIDNQAFGRVYRFGQLKESHYQKTVVEDSVDKRLILRLQREKERDINAIMQDEPRRADLEQFLGGTEETWDDFVKNVEAKFEQGVPQDTMESSMRDVKER